MIGAVAAMLVLLPPAATAMNEPFLISLFSRVVIYALAAVSLDLILGYGGLVSLGHAAFFGAGAYTVGILAFHAEEGTPVMEWPVVIGGSTDALVAWPAAVGVAVALGAIVGALSLRTRGMHFIMITLAFAQMLFFLFVSMVRYGGADGLPLWSRYDLLGLDLADDTTFYYVCLGLLVLYLLVCCRVTQSRFGLVMQGARQNERRLRALGYPVFRYRWACFMLGAAGAGLAGALIANQTEFVSPSLLHWTRSGEIMVMVILGGLGTLFGPVLGAAALLLLEDALAAHTEHWMVILGPVLVAVVLFARNGLFGALRGRDADEG